MSVVVKPSARETFTPRELATAYQDFTESGPQYLNAESGLKASTYRFGTRVLIAYEETETGVVLLVHPTSQDEMSSRSVDTSNPGSIDRIAHAKYLRNDGLSYRVYRTYRLNTGEERIAP
jgi:hypothetical protein